MAKKTPPKFGDPQLSAATSVRWQLGEFELDETRRELRRGEVVIEIEPKPLNLLMLLVRHPGELITKQELIDQLWDGRLVSDTVIARSISKLRAALGGREDWIRNIHGYGYRYDGWVEPITTPQANALPTQLTPGTVLPGRPDWVLQSRLGHSGETWLARRADGEQRVYKLALDAARLTALKREATVHRLLSTSPGTEAELATLLDWNFHAAPYFLEFAWCAGGNLAEWLARQPAPLPRPQRLALVAQLAQKLSAIHALGVLHKDLKPDNILVLAEPPGTLPRLALADFGSGGLVDLDRLRTLGVTRLGLTISALDTDSDSGTPLYLAPEVVAGRPWMRQSDIYALGVLLYQLLVNDLRRPLAPGWERDIDDPLLCEDIAAACDQSPTHRLADAAQLAERLQTLEARRAQRTSAAAASSEAARLRVSLARARLRRGWQWALSATLLLGLTLSSVLYWQAREAQQQAERAQRTAQAVSQFMDDSLLGKADPYRAGGGRNVTIASVLDQASHDFERLQGQPQLQVRLGRTLASAYHNLGLEPQALAIGQKALKAAADARLDLADADLNTLRDQIAWIHLTLAQMEAARALFKQNIAHASTPRSAHKAQYGLAHVLFAEGYFAESAAGYQALLDTTPPSALDDGLVADLRWDLAESDFERHRWQQAGALLAQVRSHYQQQLGGDNARLLWLGTSEAYRLQMLERFDEAEQRLTAIRAEAIPQLGEQHPIATTALHLLAIVRIKQGRAAEALPMTDTVLAWRLRHYGEGHYLTRMSAGRKAEALMLLGRADEALPLLRQHWQASAKALGAAHPHSLDLQRMVAESLAATGASDEAVVHFREVLTLGPERLPAHNNRLAWARVGLGRLLLQQGAPDEGRALLQQAAADFEQNFGADHSVARLIAEWLRAPAAPTVLAQRFS